MEKFFLPLILVSVAMLSSCTVEIVPQSQPAPLTTEVSKVDETPSTKKIENPASEPTPVVVNRPGYYHYRDRDNVVNVTGGDCRTTRVMVNGKDVSPPCEAN